jgi:hypothetical protein
MKKIILILLLTGLAFTQGIYQFNVYELDKSANPWEYTYANVESVLVIRYDDDGTTVVDSLYTDTEGRVEASDAFRGDSYERVYFVKSGYNVGDNGWIRFSTANFDSTSDTLAISGRMTTSPSDSTVTITFTLVNANGQPNDGQTVKHYSSTMFEGTGGSIFAGTNASDPFYLTTYTSNSSGVVEITTLKGNDNYIMIGDQLLTPKTFVADSNMTLGNLEYSPSD